MSTQSDMDRDVDSLAIVDEHAKTFLLRLQDGAKLARTDIAIDAIADLSNSLEDLLSDFRVAISRAVDQANRANDQYEARHNRSLIYPAA